MQHVYEEWIRLLPAGVEATTESGDKLELTTDVIAAIWSETKRRHALHAERGATFAPPIYQTDAPHETSSKEYGIIDPESLEVRDDGGYGLAKLGKRGYEALEAKEIRNVSPGIEALFDEELGEQFRSHLVELSPTTRPRFQSAQLDGDGETLELAASIEPRSVRLTLTKGNDMSSKTDDGNADEELEADETAAADEELEADETASTDEELEGQEGEAGAAEIEQLRTLVNDKFDQIMAQLSEVAEAVSSGMEGSEDEELEASQAETPREPSEPSEPAGHESLRGMVREELRAALGPGTTNEVGEAGGSGDELKLSQRFESYDEAYNSLAEEHGRNEASRILLDSELEPED